MPSLISNVCTIVTAAAFCGFSSISQAQNDGRWYQVELLIFSHEQGASAEQWEATPTLAYPNAARFLVYPELLESRQAEHGGISEVDEFGRQFLRVENEDTESPDAATDIPRQDQQPATDPNTPSLDPNAIVGTASAPEVLEPLLPTPFIALPHSSREFHGKAAYMQRTGSYQTLFHETWVQPFREERFALPLIIDRSGDSGNWPRLQGSINFHISRFLHIETNLWLNTHGDYLPGEWSMPAPPLGPLSLIVEEPEPELELEPYYPGRESNPAPGEELMDGPETPEEASGPLYPYRHAVLFSQKRRMRSNEVHYIDHPLLGLVVKITPLDDEALQAMAEAQDSGDMDLNKQY